MVTRRRKSREPHPALDPAPREELPEGTPIGVWLIAGTPVDQPYPCKCRARCTERCPCHGRSDPPGLKCCAYVHDDARPPAVVPLPVSPVPIPTLPAAAPPAAPPAVLPGRPGIVPVPPLSVLTRVA